MRLFEAGVMDSQFPFDVRWTGEIIEALNVYEAESVFGDMGFYRNLVVRELEPSKGN